MDTAELLKKVRKIELKTRGLSRHLFAGGYHSAFKGRGMSFSEVRAYQFGDDVRDIDWNVTARTGEPHVKVYEEERELTVLLLVDVSGSSFFGTGGASKQTLQTELCALLSFSALANNDKVGLLLFSDKPELFIPPGKGRRHFLRIIRELLNVQSGNKKTDLAATLRYVHNLQKKRSVCFILSDFTASDYETPLRILARRHDCIGLHTWDQGERYLPDVGLLHIRDAETGAMRWVDTTDPGWRRKYNAQFDEHVSRTKDLFLKAGADFISLQTGEPYANVLLQFFEQRTHPSAP